MSGKYRFSPTAAAQLDALSDYGYRRFGAQQADNYIDGLFASIQEAANSKSYKGLPLKQVPPDKLTGITTLSIYYLLYKKHYLYFRTLSDGALGVVCILGGRMDTPRRLKEQLSPPVTDIE